MRGFGLQTVCFVLTAVTLCGVGRGQDTAWPHFRGPNYDGVPLDKTLAGDSVREVWKADVHTGFSSMSIVGDRLYAMGNQNGEDVVTCLDATDGREVWNFRYPCKLDPNLYQGGPSATPTIDGRRVYTISKFGHIFCLDAATGEKVWEASAAEFRPKTGRWWGFAGSPTVIGDVVLFNAGSRGLALDKQTGKVVWSSEAGTIAYCTIVPLPETMLGRPAIVVLTNNTLSVVDPATGKPAAEVQSPFARPADCSAVTPVVFGGALYVTHAKEGMSRLALADKTFSSKWLQRKPAMSWFTFNNRVLHDGRIYFLGRKGGLNCLDADTGDVLWVDEKYAFGNLLLVGDTLLMLAEDGQVIWGPLAGGRFQEAARAKVLDDRCWAYPVLHGGRLYARSARGTVVCLEFE